MALNSHPMIAGGSSPSIYSGGLLAAVCLHHSDFDPGRGSFSFIVLPCSPALLMPALEPNSSDPVEWSACMRTASFDRRWTKADS